MSVIVKGVEMPNRCIECFCCDDAEGFCCALIKYLPMMSYRNYKYSGCPLSELPAEHGKLIDADVMCADLTTVNPLYKTMIDWCIRVTKAQPTVVEAEGR